MRHLICIILLPLLFGHLSHGQQIRSISDKDGRDIEVIFYNKTESGIHVIRTDGHDFTIGIDSLHPASQKVVQAWMPKYPIRSLNDVRTDYGFACYTGKTARKDLRRAFQVFQKSAENGDASAQNMLGMMYLDGEGVSTNKVLGARWVERSARQGNMIAEGVLGRLYMDGEGVQKNYTTAAMYLERAAAKNYAAAQSNLGILYYFGNGVRLDKTKGLELLHKASAAGDEGAKKILARIDQDSRKSSAQRPIYSGSSATQAFVSKVDNDDNDVITLQNGAIVEVSLGYVGYIGWNKAAILFNKGSQWMIWIEGKKAYRCDILKEPSGRRTSAEMIHISEVVGGGSILKLLSGGLLEVDSLNTIDTSLWLGVSDALLINGSSLVNLDEGELIEVTRLK